MALMETIRASRQALHAQLFPQGIPRLWCPTLTHFRAAREPDAVRIRVHLSVLARHVRGILVPGSTGEGWEMNDADIRVLLGIVLDAAAESGVRVLIGVLKTDVDEMLACLDAMEDFRVHPAVAGLTICPPKGAALTQAEIRDGVRHVLARGWPTALYQLPQVTQNEMTAETVAVLAAEFPNFILFKDTSGTDRVAQSGFEFGGVFMVRGAEAGGYAQWPRAAGGPYDGFLLSTANVFAGKLAQLLRLLDAGNVETARALSAELADVVRAAFAIVTSVPHGNAFANANKALDHCMAHGEDATRIEPPLLYGGARLPADSIERAVELLRAHALLPARGYLS
jgi:4-hydroxy-tetrahydrodipicolinate synthase